MTSFCLLESWLIREACFWILTRRKEGYLGELIGWRVPHSLRRNNFLVWPIQHDHGARTPHWLIYVSPVYCACATACSSWWHLSPQSLCQQQGLLLWCLLLCMIMWFLRIQRKWYFWHKPCTNRARLFRCWWWSSWGMRVYTWGLTSSPEVGRWQEGLWHGLFFPVFIFSSPLVSEGESYIYLMQNKFIFLKVKWLKQN